MIKSGVGVIIGRFQVPEFHDGHKYLLDTVNALHNRMIVLLGCITGNPTVEDPLDYSIRAQMIYNMYPGVSCVPIFDMADDDLWSKEVDKIIAALSLAEAVTIYGGRNSFIDYYTGKYPIKEITSIIDIKGTDIRNSIQPVGSSDFRNGVIWGLRQQFPRVNPTVDIALIRDDCVLLGKKHNSKYWVFPGGYFDTRKDKSFEDAAVRELYEETGMTLANGIKDLKYVCSTIVDDWRFKNKRDKTLTVLFQADYFSGIPQASDDLDNVDFFRIQHDLNIVAPWHRPLMEALVEWNSIGR